MLINATTPKRTKSSGTILASSADDGYFRIRKQEIIAYGAVMIQTLAVRSAVIVATREARYGQSLNEVIMRNLYGCNTLCDGMTAEKQTPKARFSTKLPNGDFLGVTIWPGKTEPSAEVVTVQIRHPTGNDWETTARIALYRTPDGKYSLLPERPVTQSSQKTEAETVGATEEN